MKNIVVVPKKNTGYGYVGVWHDGSIGLFMPQFVRGEEDKKSPGITDNSNADGDRFFLCKITIEPLLDKKKRPITKIAKTK